MNTDRAVRWPPTPLVRRFDSSADSNPVRQPTKDIGEPTAGGWFADAGAYDASDRHASVLAVFRSALARARPAQVRPDEAATTGEGPAVCILVVPHHCLGGVALVAWSDADGVDVLWADVGDLGRHDGIDLGPRVASVRRHEPRWEEQLDQVVTAELARPLTLRPRFVGPELESVVATIELDGETKTLSRVRSGKRRLWGRRDGEPEVTSLAAPEPPTVAIPVPWRKSVAEP